MLPLVIRDHFTLHGNGLLGPNTENNAQESVAPPPIPRKRSNSATPELSIKLGTINMMP